MKIISGLIGLFFLLTSSFASASSPWPTGGNLTSTVTTTRGPMGAAQTSKYYKWTYSDSHGVHTFTPVSWEYGVYPQGNYWGGTTSVTETSGPDQYGIYYTLSATGSKGSVSLSTVGQVYPKYIVLSVMYTPPGVGSTIDYQTSDNLGTATTVNSIFSNTNTVTAGFGMGVGSVVGATGSLSNSWTQTVDYYSSMAINKTRSLDQGVIAHSDLIDHDYDQFIIWINPVVKFSASPSGGLIWAYDVDSRDTTNVDIITVAAHELSDPTNKYGKGGMLQGNLNALKRSWSSTGALNASDYATILAANPFWNGATTIDINTRFTLQSGQTVNFTPDGFTNYLNGTTVTSGNGLTATNSFAQSFEANAHVSLFLSASVTASGSMSVTNKVQSEQTRVLTNQASIKLQPSKAGYTGPTDFLVYRDNIYGTFLLAPLH